MRHELFGATGLFLAFSISAAAASPPGRRDQPEVRPTVSPTGALSDRDLLGIVLLTLEKRGDSFSADPAGRFVGRRFRITQTLKENGTRNEEADGSWSYDNRNHSMTFSVDDDQYHVMFASRRIGSYLGQNAFGVKARVLAYHDTSVVLVPRSESTTERLAPLSVVVGADSQTGRALSKSVRFVVEGEIVGNPSSVVTCDTHENPATIDDPVYEITESCSIGVQVDRIAFVDILTGITLKELVADRTPAHAWLPNPEWTHTPSDDDVTSFYPERARRREVSGRAEISCVVQAAGSLKECSVLSEEPSDQQFGEAALNLASLYSMAPRLADGTLSEGRSVRLPIRFQPPPR
ncbi:MAG: TonB family protein [Caulobacteraceae bacterium]